MPVTVREVERTYREGEPLTMLTAYDAPTAHLVDASGVDMILVGDSTGHNHMGYEDTLPVTLADALANTASVVRGAERALVIGDMPFMSYSPDIDRSVHNAGRFLQESGADAVKLETAPRGETTVEIVRRCIELGIPVQGHLGLTPQRVNELGGPVIQGREGPDSTFADTLVETASDLEDAGVFTLVLEGLTEGVARRVTEFVEEVRSGAFPGREHVYEPVDDCE